MKSSKRKALGQHFLKNPRVISKIVQLIDPQKDELIIEIGAGKGALTLPLAQEGGLVIALEKDPNFISPLKGILLFPDIKG